MDGIKPWQALTIQDDYMFKLIMGRKRLCKKMLEKLLDLKIKRLKYMQEEKTINTRYEGKGIRLDIYVEDERKTVYNVEMQVRKPTGDGLAKRTRYYQSMIDMDLLAAGEDYDELNKTIIIFICPFDPIGKGRHIYTFKNICVQDKDIELGDGATKIFVNTVGKINDVKPDVKAFLDYVNGIVSDDEFVQELDAAIKEVKQQELEGEKYMTYALKMKEERKEGIEEGKKIGRKEGLKEGLAKGLAQGVAQGVAQGLAQGMIKTLYSLAKAGEISMEKAAQTAGLSLSLFLEKAKQC